MTLIEYPDLEQGSAEWLQARCGIVTASVVGKLITPTLKVANNETSRGLVLTLAAERITGHVDPTWVSADMERGNLEEPWARGQYAKHYGDVTELGFMVREWDEFRIGYSPDGLVGDVGLIEIKSRRQNNHVKIILSNEVPQHHMAQIQCGLMVSGRDWCDYVDHSDGMPQFVKRVEPNQRWFDAIANAVDDFEENVADTMQRYEAAIADLPATEPMPDFSDIQVA